MSTDGQTSDPRASLAPAIEAVAGCRHPRGDARRRARRGRRRSRAVDGRDLRLRSRTAPASSSSRRTAWTTTAAARLSTAVNDPADPFTTAAVTRIATFDREATAADGSGFIGAYLPLVVGSGGVDTVLGCDRLRLAGAARARRDRAGDADRRWPRLAALAIDRTRLASTAAERSEWFERMAHTDPLTGLANERTVGRVLELELARAGRQGSEVSFAMFDVDDFRATNEEGGHEAGDDVLRRVAAVLAESVRLVDTVGRIGGDEFVLVAPGSAGAMVARRILDGIAALPAVGGRQITVSAGVARFPVDGTDAAGADRGRHRRADPGARRGSGLGRLGRRQRRIGDAARRRGRPRAGRSPRRSPRALTSKVIRPRPRPAAASAGSSSRSSRPSC